MGRFHSESPWLTITVCPEGTEDDEAEVTGTDSGLVVTETATSGESDCQIWFSEQAAAKADEVEFVGD